MIHEIYGGMKNLWVEYRISANLDKQKQIIQNLKGWIEEMEERELIQGYAFNHYTRPSTTLNIRFDLEKQNLSQVEEELKRNLRQLGESDDIQRRDWPGDEYVRRAYEIGSRWAFVFMNSNRVPQNLTQSQSFNFYCLLVHGVLNSLGMNYDQEKALHRDLLGRLP